MARALLIHNPAARNAPDPALLAAIRSELAMAGFSVEAVGTSGPGDLARIARDARDGDFERVVVCGGDGSVREAAEGLMGSQTPLGIVPTGTVNVLARELGLPVRSPRACAVVAARSGLKQIGLGTVGADRAFTFCASAGLDSLAVAKVDLLEKTQTGPWAYAHAALNGLLGAGLRPLLVTLPDGTRREAAQVFAVRSRRYGGRFALSSKARLDSPRMTLLLVAGPLLPRLPCLLPRLLASGIEGAPGVQAFEVGSFRLDAPDAFPVQADGDLVGRTPATFFSKPAALWVAAEREMGRNGP